MSPNSTASVLVVEDDALLRRAYERVLSPDYRVTAVGSGRDALSALRQGSYSVVISDIDLPESSGIDLLKAVRATDLDVPVVLVTGCPTLESAQDAVNHGAHSYLTKPVAAAALREAVVRATRLHRLLLLQRAAGGALGHPIEHASDQAGREVRFESALSTLWMAFQPIVSMQKAQVIGYEALLRTDEPTLKSPPDLLATAEKLGRLNELGRRVRERVAQAIPMAPADVAFFINLHPHDLRDDALYAADSALAPFARRIVLEITERASLEDVHDLGDRVATLREQGYRLAIDDLGAGYAGLTSLSRLEPEVVKLDMSLVRGVDASRTKQQLVLSMCRVCEDLGMQVVTEGVETVAERDTLVGLGCDALQGYHFGRPQRGFAEVTLPPPGALRSHLQSRSER